MRRISIALLTAFALAVVVSGCAKTEDHSWKGEFDARLEGAGAVIEEAEEEGNPGRPTRAYLATSYRLGARLEHDYLVIDELNPPATCKSVQVKGKTVVRGDAALLAGLFKNLTPSLEHHLVEMLGHDVETIEKREREAETCA